MLGNIISVYKVSSELNFLCYAEKFAGAPELRNGGKFMQKIFIRLSCFGTNKSLAPKKIISENLIYLCPLRDLYILSSVKCMFMLLEFIEIIEKSNSNGKQLEYKSKEVVKSVNIYNLLCLS